MKWKSTYAHPEGYTFFIEYELLFDSINRTDFHAYYLIGETDDRTICNYMQEEFEAATEQAYEDFGVPEDSWVQVED